MKFGLIVTDDDPIRQGEEGTAQYIINRFNEKNKYNDDFVPIFPISNELPKKYEIMAYDGFIITGSHYSVNDGYDWEEKLENFIRTVFKISLEFNKPKIYGMCFGHQIIAKALGGRVSNNPDGKFNFGSVDVQLDKSFMNFEFFRKSFGKIKTRNSVSMMKLHGECVEVVPKIARHIGSSTQCKNEILMYGNTILSSQGHPEYTKLEMLTTNTAVVKQSGRLENDEIVKSLKELNDEDNDKMTEMVRSFLRWKIIEN